MIVLDSSVLLIVLHREPGAEQVKAAITRYAHLSAVNLAEVLSKLTETGEDPQSGHSRLLQEGLLGTLLKIHPLTPDDATVVARLRPLTKAQGLSLGDRACLSLGIKLDLPVLTADRSWEKVNAGVTVHLVQR